MGIDHDQVVRILLRDRDKLFAYIWSIVRDDHAAEDVFQEISLLAINKREEIANEAVLPSWLRSTARYRAMHIVRDSGREAVTIDGSVFDLMEGEWEEYDSHDTIEMLEVLRVCLDRLSESAHRLIELRYRENLKPAAIAKKLDLKVGTVYVTITRAHKALAECVNRRIGDPGGAR